jgi:hypothetical protein
MCLAVSLGPWHPEVSHHVLLRVAPLLVADQHDRLPIESSETTDDRRVFGKVPVPGQLEKVGEQHPHVVQEVGARRMAR